MAYDAAHGQIVLFGGYGNLSDTWIWDGSNWIQANPAQKPSARWAPAMAYDESHAQIVLFGGYAYSGDWQSDTWIWTKKPEIVFLPIVISSSGMNGSFLTSELILTNRAKGSVISNP